MTDALLSVNGVARWLKAKGLRPYTRHSVYLAIAHQRLPVFAAAPRVVLIRQRDVEKYARALAEEGKHDHIA